MSNSSGSSLNAVLLDEGVDEVEVLDQGVPNLESVLGREGEDFLYRLGQKIT